MRKVELRNHLQDNFQCSEKLFVCWRKELIKKKVDYIVFCMGNTLYNVTKGNMPDNAQLVRNNAEFIGITEVPIDIHLLDGGSGRAMGRHGSVGCFIRVEGSLLVVCFFEGFQLADDTVGIFRVTFRNPGLNTRGIKKEYGSFCRINPLADQFRQINKAIKHRL